MKTKLFIIVAIIAILLLLPKVHTAYSGKYYLKGSSAELLELNANNTFTIYITKYKNSTIISGKYNISNNHIELQADDKGLMQLIPNLSSGEVTGSVITFPKLDNNESSIFTKS